eukprot:2606456-Pyramimonas_sp.AAC.1
MAPVAREASQQRLHFNLYDAEILACAACGHLDKWQGDPNDGDPVDVLGLLPDWRRRDSGRALRVAHDEARALHADLPPATTTTAAPAIPTNDGPEPMTTPAA